MIHFYRCPNPNGHGSSTGKASKYYVCEGLLQPFQCCQTHETGSTSKLISKGIFAERTVFYICTYLVKFRSVSVFRDQ